MLAARLRLNGENWGKTVARATQLERPLQQEPNARERKPLTIME
jgi:hypothetical protein